MFKNEWFASMEKRIEEFMTQRECRERAADRDTRLVRQAETEVTSDWQAEGEQRANKGRQTQGARGIGHAPGWAGLGTH